ncbi:hypothetical protein U0355_09135 [Salimicrobium sp. PL1-032A]|uniref:hypothetical protein n=1 Tax=Salimicrobium sp. PL1-032A TaxID=3095364 RepID=UPI00326199FC
MIKSRKAIISSLLIMCVCAGLFFPYPDNPMVGVHSTLLSFPIMNEDGYIIRGIIGAVLLVTGLIMLAAGMKKYRFRAVILLILLYTALPPVLITVHQETFASGIGAVSLKDNGVCEFEERSKDVVDGHCELVFHNRSNEPVTFELTFLDSSFAGKDMRVESLMNIEGPYSITIEANEERRIEVDESIDVSDMTEGEHVDSGASFDIHLKLRNEGNERIL